MKILSILGSPIRNGNTATLLHMVEKGMMEAQPNCEIQEIYLQEKNIQACTGCLACDTGCIKHCIIQDDMTELYEQFEEAELLVFATPIYYFSMTAQMKTFLDRLYAVHFEKWKKKQIVLLMTYGGDDEEDSGAVNLVRIIEYLAEHTGAKFVDRFGVSTQMRPNSVEENDQILNAAYEFGRKLLS